VSSLVYSDLLTADYITGSSATNALQSEAPDPPTALTAVSRAGAVDFSWTLESFWTLNGISELWEYTASTPFASATKIWEGRSSSVTITKTDTTTRYYWVRIRTIGGQTSSTFPAATGQAGAANPISTGNTAQGAGPITKTLTAPASNATVQAIYAEFAHDPSTRVDIQVTVRVGVTTAAAPGAWHADLVTFYGSTAGSVAFVGQQVVKSDTAYQVMTLVCTLPPGSVVGSATRRFGIALDIYGDGVNNVDVILRDYTVTAIVSYP
jgi:hypothetical protein